jgi:predicted metal-dependent phosphoesterase TrpH
MKPLNPFNHIMTNRREFLKHVTLLGTAAAALPMTHILAADTPAQPADEGLFAVSYAKKVKPAARKPRSITIPDSEGFKVLKGDFHMHTLFSDGLVMPKDRVNEAVNNGLDVIAITDHIEYRICLGGTSGNNCIKLAENNDDHNAAYNLAKPFADEQNLILVRGTEITKKMMPPGHFNALFVQDVNPIAAAVDDWKKMLAVATDQGGFVHWNHPGWIAPASGGLEKGVPMCFTDEHESVRAKGHLHGVEVFNGSEFYPIALDWCNERDIAPMANTDIHPSDWNAYGHQNLQRPMTLIFAKDRSYESVREAFFAKRTVGWAANMILGRPEWVEKLFRSCVQITKTGGGLKLQNISDIPCVIEANGKTLELLPQGSAEMNGTPPKTLIASNWLVGLNKPLEVAVS